MTSQTVYRSKRVVVHLPEKPVYGAEQRGTFPAEVLRYEYNELYESSSRDDTYRAIRTLSGVT